MGIGLCFRVEVDLDSWGMEGEGVGRENGWMYELTFPLT